MFLHQKDNSTTSRNNQTAQKSQKEKTMAASPARSLADIDITKPLTQEEQAMIAQHNANNTGSSGSTSNILADYYPGKYSENNFGENLEKESFGYTNKNATIYDNPKTHKATGSISASTKVEILEVLKEYSKVSIIGSNSDTIWLSNADYSFTELGLGFVKHTALYNDIELYEAPFGEKKTIKLEAGKKYHLLRHCKNSKTNDQYSEVYPEKKSDLGREGLLPESDKPLGWVLNYQYVLSVDNRRSREVADYKKVVLGYLSEAYEKTGKEKILFVQSCLEKIWNKYKTAANYVESNPNENATVPHELIELVRKLINIVESKSCADEAANDTYEPVGWDYPIKEPEAEKTPVVGGSLHSDIDWNSKLGVPQYRTQSDNLVAPEVTCAVTSFAMAMERLGHGRENIIKAIEVKLLEGQPENANVSALWESKSKEFLEKVNSTAQKDYRKLRSNQGGVVGNEEELSKKFKDFAQMEDLVDFYFYLNDNNPLKRANIFGWDTKSKKLNRISDFNYKKADESLFHIETEKKWTQETRDKIKKALDDGASVVLNVKHKGVKTDGHMLVVKTISSEGLVVDDPYGKHAPDYRYGKEGDLFAGKNKGSMDRGANGEPYRNTKHFNTAETDFTKKDFTAEAAQNLEPDESKGNTVLIKFEVLNEKPGFISGVFIYKNKI